jgi:DNA-binding transcriptional LysR family regulator
MAASHGSNNGMTGLDDLALFVGIAEAGSLAAAARAAGLPKSSVSRRLAALEVRLGTSLVRRSTRRLALTDAGRALYERCAPLLTGLRAAQAELLDGSVEPHGRLRVTATGTFGRWFIGPLLGAFLKRHPRVSAELVLLDRPVDLIGEGFDVAIRMGPLATSSLLRRKLADIERVLCAAPAYLDRAGPLEDVDDLRRHEAVTSVEGNRWAFTVEGGVQSVIPLAASRGTSSRRSATRRVRAAGPRCSRFSSSRRICAPDASCGCSGHARCSQARDPRAVAGQLG